MLIKICGMTSKKDIDICIENKVDIVGFLLQPPSKSYKRKDMLTIEVAKELISLVPNNMDSCLLIHTTDLNKVLITIENLNPNMIQIQKQSKLTFGDLKKIKVKFSDIKITKTFYIDKNITTSKLINDIKSHIDYKLIDFVLLDSKIGGSGKTHNWDISAKIVNKIYPFPVLLAGGLTPNNIKESIFHVNPYGIDVMSGVSERTYEKNSKKISLLVNNIKLFVNKNKESFN